MPGVRESPNLSVLEALEKRLEVDETLLLVDNCEHLVEGCAGLADALLRSCPNLKILATSREVLGVGGEVVWAAPPLSVPDGRDASPPEALLRHDAARLASGRQIRAGASAGWRGRRSFDAGGYGAAARAPRRGP